MNRCHACPAALRQVGHRKTQDGGDHVTDVTDVTPNREGVYVTPVRRRARALAASTHTPSERCDIRDIRDTPRPVGRFYVSHQGVTPPIRCDITGMVGVDL